jgi:hypothetical protein
MTTGKDNWSAKIYKFMRYTAIRETVRWTLHHRQHPKNESVKAWAKMLKRSSISGSVIIDQGAHVSCPVLKRKTVELIKKLGHNNFKATGICLNGNANEIGLFYPAKTDGFLSYKHATLIHKIEWIM